MSTEAKNRRPQRWESGALRLPVGNGLNEASALAHRLLLDDAGYDPERYEFVRFEWDADGRWFVYEPKGR